MEFLTKSESSINGTPVRHYCISDTPIGEISIVDYTGFSGSRHTELFLSPSDAASAYTKAAKKLLDGKE